MFTNKDKLPMSKLLNFFQTRNTVKEAQKRSSGLFDPSSKSFQMTLGVSLGLLVASIFGGMFWEMKYHTKAIKDEKEKEKQRSKFSLLNYTL